MKFKTIVVIAICLLLIPAQTYAEDIDFDEIKAYGGIVGPNNIFYGFKLILERVDETLTFDPVRKVEKQLENAELRIAEAKAEMLHNRVNVAEATMARYTTKMATINAGIKNMLEGDKDPNATRIENLQKTMERQMETIRIMEQDNSGLSISTRNIEEAQTKLIAETGKIYRGKITD